MGNTGGDDEHRCSCGTDLELQSDDEGRTIGTCPACSLIFFVSDDAHLPDDPV